MKGSLVGRLLIASPALDDPRFARSIIFVCAHDPDHAMGVVVNRPVSTLTLSDMMDRLDIPCSIDVPARPVLNGGPCDQERGFVLHSNDYFSEEATLIVATGVSLTATKEVLTAIGNTRSPRKAVLALGYAGWTGGQLESEIVENAWLVGDGDTNAIFGQDHDTKWTRALNRLGVDPGLLSSQVGRA